MVINISARHFKADDKLKLFINSKMEKLQTFYSNISKIDVVLAYQKETQIVEIKLHLNDKSKMLFIKDKSDDIFKAIESASERLEKQLKRYKGKLNQFEHENITQKIEK